MPRSSMCYSLHLHRTSYYIEFQCIIRYTYYSLHVPSTSYYIEHPPITF